MEALVPYTIGEIAERIHGTVIGNSGLRVQQVCTPENMNENSIVFIRDKKTWKGIDPGGSMCLVVSFEPDETDRTNYIVIEPEKKDEAFITILSLFQGSNGVGSGIARTALISPDAGLEDDVSIGEYTVIDENTRILTGSTVGPHVFIGRNCSIGKNCTIHPNVSIYPNTVIGDDVIIHAGVVIGSDGFGYSPVEGEHRKIPQIGGVEIGNRVEIGANTTIDRATIGMTRIDDGTKIDNLVQIAHNVEIGKNVIICALSGISGSVKIGNNVIIAGAVGLKDHIVIEDDVYIGAKAGVMEKVVKKGRRMLGTPAVDFKTAMEYFAMWPKLKQMFNDIRMIKKKLGL
jgi:UDP-3-O-[3-hydroxymyristoyl] glucosamine N-acyltransferase